MFSIPAEIRDVIENYIRQCKTWESQDLADLLELALEDMEDKEAFNEAFADRTFGLEGEDLGEELQLKQAISNLATLIAAELDRRAQTSRQGGDETHALCQEIANQFGSHFNPDA